MAAAPGAARTALAVAIWVGVAALVLSLSIFPLSNYDTWWHLEAGEYIATEHAIPVRDVFSFTAEGARWISHEWLFELLAYLFHSATGFNGLILAKAALVLASFAALYVLFRRLGVGAAAAGAVLVPVAFMTTYMAYERPHIVTQLFAALFLLALLTYKHRPDLRSPGRLLLALLPLQVVWANSHAGMILGPILVGLFVAGEALQAFLAPRLKWLAPDVLNPRELGFLALAVVLLVAVSLVNPSFHHLLFYTGMIAGDPVFKQAIREWQPTINFGLNSDVTVIFWPFLAVGALSFLATLRRLQLSHVLLYAATGAAAISAIRNVALFALVGAPLVAINLHALSRGDEGRRRLRGVVAAAAVAAVALACVALVFTRGTRVSGTYRHPGLGVAERMFPGPAADFLEQNPVQGQVFNSMELGGYLIWRWYPARKVFVDGRLDVYGRELFDVYAATLRSQADPDAVARRFDIGCFLISQPNRDAASAPWYLGRTLARNPGWALVFWDDRTLLFVRNTAAHRALIERKAYRAIVPMMLGYATAPGTDRNALLAEAQRASRESPGPLTLMLLGQAYLDTGRPDKAREAYEQVLALDADNEPARAALERLVAIPYPVLPR
ncbi:MAG: tetratricopeptide repeat protein [Acidobacteria bacterium]|nr:tetratricopeptide repeat protein [Acidobacteriota bacterium]